TSPWRKRRWRSAGRIPASGRGRPDPCGPGARMEIRLTADWVASAMGGVVVAGEGMVEFAGVSIDSRTIAPGELFVAIRGERFDGADFVPRAIEAGAAGIVISRALRPSKTGSAAVIAVDDTIAALQSLAREVRRKSGTKVVAITGSAGKTTT